MKCPKCNYLGFETGDRCKNCGYDFSLLSVAESEPADYEIHPAAVDDLPVRVVDRHIEDDLPISLATDTSFEEVSLDPELESDDTADLVEAPLTAPVVPFMATGASASANAEPLPLFTPPEHADDEPLIKLPPAPRPPLAVRRTPDTPRLRAVPRPVSRPSPAPVLQFSEEVVDRPAVPREPVAHVAPRQGESAQPIRPGARLTAVVIDYLILVGIDAGVLYFTLRLAGLSMDEWRLLPLVPLLAFLGLVKVAYFYAFTAVGGQTIGKMAVGTCVVADNGNPVDAARAMRRTSAGIVSFLLLGAGFIPALFGEQRALHDRLAGTRVVRLRSV